MNKTPPLAPLSENRIGMQMTKPRKPTIYEALKTKLEREPTHVELCNEVKRILKEAA